MIKLLNKLKYSCTILYFTEVQQNDLQFLKGYTSFNYYKILAIFPMLYNITLQLMFIFFQGSKYVTPLYFLINFYSVQLIYSVVLVSAVQPNQLYVYVYPLFFRFYSYIGHYRVLGRVPCVYSRFLLVICAMLCLVAPSCLTLCVPMDCSPPGSFVHGILQARILEWLA